MVRKTAKAETRQVGDRPEAAPGLDAPEGRNIIVAIGINDYAHHAPLDNPINDARAVLEVFKQCGFEELPAVPSLLANDATRGAIAALPEQLATELTADDNLLLFFAGHGDKKEKQAPDPAQPGKTYTHRTGYLIPVDSPGDRPSEWIRLDAFLDDINALPARHIFVILDACKSGIALADKFKVKGAAQPTSLATLRQLPSRRVLTSALHNEKAAEGGKGSGHSVFAEALIAAIQDRQADKDEDGFIKTVDLYSFVQDQVSDRALRLFNLKQTPDYGYLPGDGSGDLVISLHEGAVSRLVEQGLQAMLHHDTQRLEMLVGQLVAAKPAYPPTLFLQFRLRFMQGDLDGATAMVSQLLAADWEEGDLPLTRSDLEALRIQLAYWRPVLALTPQRLPINVTMRTGTAHAASLLPAERRRCAAGYAYEIKDGAVAQFEVHNRSASPAHLYYMTVSPLGQLVPGPLLRGSTARINGLAPGAVELGSHFKVRGPPGSVTETRILYSREQIPELLFPEPIATRDVEEISAASVAALRMTLVCHQVRAKAPRKTGKTRWHEMNIRKGKGLVGHGK